ncbi:LysR family transcriptional regulator [Flavobacterium sp. GSP27]|uniref:LysR family transcriptional regulator n=1 Tax=Flavobacterium bomense TaxID=2497483 RepID=A0A3S0P061_9FLAO|nr:MULTISPECIES: LysR family transcriptional regulator [Flavobacterium]RTY91761.1 LysR family transcriptional regulator [Flavobacterium sp. GSN2]RTY68960.1 LysR family transcriptional regulator [Flavobacterium sp. LB2P53]RTY80778.1 LysR family transcriptional regulator [Flavobacterium sp. LS1P28]RTZ03898.1 LysR family transcriptional regulator [Flavobacterium bomense]RTZ05296.1 LysR family transcriptional regulator [Flavobacterium sp. GSP6]
MNYTLHQLHVFLKITQNKSITKAAMELHLTQPAVSIQLKNFQDQFDVPLTEVIGRKLFVTDFGKEIATAAEKILNEVHAINYKTMAFKGQLTGRLKISVVSTGKYVIPYFLSDFLKQNQGVELILDVTNKTKVLKNLERNEVDFSLVSVLPETLQIEKVELMPNSLFLVANSDQKMGKGIQEKKIIETLPIIYREQGSGTRYVMEKFIEQNQLTVSKKMVLTGNEAVKQAVLAGLGCSIMPLIGIKNELNNGDLQIIPVKGLPIQSNWNLIWLKGKKFSPVADAYLKFIQKEKTRIIEQTFNWITL